MFYRALSFWNIYDRGALKGKTTYDELRILLLCCNGAPNDNHMGPAVAWIDTSDHNSRLFVCVVGDNLVSIPLLFWSSPETFLLAIETQFRAGLIMKAIIFQSVWFQIKQIQHHCKRICRFAQLSNTWHNERCELRTCPLGLLSVVLAVTGVSGTRWIFDNNESGAVRADLTITLTAPNIMSSL